LTVENLNIEENDKEWSSKHESLVRECLLRHPRTKMLDFAFHPREYVFTPIVPPITLLPALEELHLTFDSWGELQFWGGETAVPDDLHLPQIRKLTRFNFSVWMHWSDVALWVEIFFAQLKKQGDLDAFEMFEIIQTDGRTKPSQLKGAIHDYLPLEKIRTNWER